MTEDLKGIKNALKFLIECKMNDEICNAQCNVHNSHPYGDINKKSYKNDDKKVAQTIKKIYKPILDGLK